MSFFGPTNPVSTSWAYDAILQRIPEGATILDIGCGDGVYFTNARVIETINAKKLTIFAIDIDNGAVEICKKRILAAGLVGRVSAKAISVLDVHETYDFVLWMESFPVISPKIFPPLFKHSLVLTKKKTLMYHNLVEDHEATWFWRATKPLLYYVTLVDFGRLTTLSEMRASLRTLTPRSCAINPLLSCTLAEMHPLSWIAAALMNVYKKGSGNRKIVQYLVEVDAAPAAATVFA